MELQWPLILFTTLVAWSAGLFASQCALAVKGEAPQAQVPAWIVSAVLLVAGGVAVFMHLEHWERIFNGFGQPTSGITQELIAIVVLAVVAVAYLALLRKGDGKAPAWIAVVGIVVSVALVVVMAHSYVMPARPAWDTPVWVLCVLGSACALGPATMAVLVEVVKPASADSAPSSGVIGTIGVVGAAVGAVGTVAYVATAAASQSTFANLGYYFDLSSPTSALANAATLSPFSGDSMPLTVAALAAVVLALVLAAVGKKRGGWIAWAAVVACSLVAAIAVRAVFYQMGESVFMFY